MRTHLPRTAVWLLVVGAAVSGASAEDWECQQCPRRSVAIFDVAIPDPSSDATLLTSEHLGMQQADGGLLTYLLRDDPSRECIDFTSAAFTQTAASGEDSHNFGQGGLPGLPPGAVPDADYVVSGEIAADDDGNYVLTVRLQAGGTREEVASGSVAWDLEEGLKVSTAQAAQLLMPLMGKIRAFEKRKRDSMTAVAIWPNRGMEVIPDPPLVNRGGTSEVTIRLTDCDGVRLKNRIVAPTSKGGILVPPEMPLTDGKGEMKVSLSLDQLDKQATVFAEHHYVLPFSADEESGANGSAVVAAGDHFVWVRIRKQVKESSRRDDRDEWGTVRRGNSEETTDVEVMMMPDFTTVEVDKEFDIAARRFIPREYSYTLLEEDAPEVTRQIFRSTYTRFERSWDGKHAIDSSGNTHDSKFSLDRVGNEHLMFRVDPSGQVTQVSLPGVILELEYDLHTACTKVVNGDTEDCSSSTKHGKQISMSPYPNDDECYIPKEQSRSRITGGCHWTNNSDDRREEHEFDWSIVLLGRRE